MAESSSAKPVPTTTVTITDNAPAQEKLVLRLRKPKTDKKVSWEEKVVDNEGMGKKSSKCCCIYSKPKTVRHDGESSGESSDDESGWDDCCHEHRMAGKRIPHKHPTTT